MACNCERKTKEQMMKGMMKDKKGMDKMGGMYGSKPAAKKSAMKKKPKKTKK